MALQPYETFKGVTDWREDGFNDNLQYGLLEWCKWAFLQIGGFENVLASQADGLYGGHPSVLRPVTDPNFTDGQVWEGFRSDWIWETGISYSVQPRQCSGVYVDGSFKPTATEVGAYEHYIDFPRGRVVFTNAVPTTSTVKTDYALRIPTIGYSKEPWLQELLYGSLQVQRSDWLVAGSGSHNQLAEARRQMPTVGLELSQRRGYHPYQLGGGQFVFQDVLLYVLAESKDERDKLLDVLGNQNDKVIVLPDRGLMKEGAQFPVDIDVKGRPVSSPMQYPSIVAPTGDGGFQWARCMLRNAQSQVMQSTNNWLYRGVVRFTCEAIFENL
jgi:hypothetical protein